MFPDTPLLLAFIGASLVLALTPGPAVTQGQPLLGGWPAAMAGTLVAYLQKGGDLAMRSWIAEAGARRVAAGEIANINTRAELVAYLAGGAPLPRSG